MEDCNIKRLTDEVIGEVPVAPHRDLKGVFPSVGPIHDQVPESDRLAMRSELLCSGWKDARKRPSVEADIWTWCSKSHRNETCVASSQRDAIGVNSCHDKRTQCQWVCSLVTGLVHLELQRCYVAYDVFRMPIVEHRRVHLWHVDATSIQSVVDGGSSSINADYT